ncbi:MAG: phosphatidate cytidylyltransferase [Chloroflexota bacterium]
MTRRVVSAFIGIPVLLAAIWLGEPWYSLLIATIAVWAAWEFYRMAGTPQPLTIFGILWTLLFIINASSSSPGTTQLLITAMVVLPLIGLILRSPTGNAWTHWASTMAGILYTGWMLSHLIWLRAFPDGRDWVILTVFSTFAADTAAFFVGRAWGKRLLAPSISPGKTCEGAIAGFLSAVIAAILLALVLGLSASYLQVLIIGSLVGVFAQFGDLGESMLKRGAGVKDAGKLIPGHGGILDRLDSVVFSAVVVYYYLVWIVL